MLVTRPSQCCEFYEFTHDIILPESGYRRLWCCILVNVKTSLAAKGSGIAFEDNLLIVEFPCNACKSTFVKNILDAIAKHSSNHGTGHDNDWRHNIHHNTCCNTQYTSQY